MSCRITTLIPGNRINQNLAEIPIDSSDAYRGYEEKLKFQEISAADNYDSE